LRTFFGNPKSTIDVIPCDYVSNATIVLTYYVANQKVTSPEVIHCTSGDYHINLVKFYVKYFFQTGEVKPLNIENFCRILNKSTKKHPNDYILWKPSVKVRNNFRYTVFEFLFHFLPALLLYIPEKIVPVKKPAHS
jgi:hypothetical protein